MSSLSVSPHMDSIITEWSIVEIQVRLDINLIVQKKKSLLISQLVYPCGKNVIGKNAIVKIAIGKNTIGKNARM